MSSLRCISFYIIVSLHALMLCPGEAFAVKVPIEVAIGGYEVQGSFTTRGYGVIVTYKEQCLLITLAHVASDDLENLELAEVTARANNLAGSIIYQDADPERDLYVGLVDPKSPLFDLCDLADDIRELHKHFDFRLKNMLEPDFANIELHSTPAAIAVTPLGKRVLNDTKIRRPIRYRLAKCPDGQQSGCSSPMKRFSGSMISVSLGDGSDRLWLGLHQGRCGAPCQDQGDAWQAVSVMQIYEFIASPNSPLNSFDTSTAAPDSQSSAPNTLRYDTPLPSQLDQSFQFQSASFEWDIAFSKFLSSLKPMRFPQREDGICVDNCSLRRLQRFYGDESQPNAPLAFRSRYEDVGDPGSMLLGSTSTFNVPFDKAAFLDVVATGKRLNAAFDASQARPENMSMGGYIGFVVQGSPKAWLRFFETVPAEYARHVEAVHVLFDRYCTNFKPAAEIQAANADKVYFGNLALYENPCLMPIAWDKMIEGDPAFIVDRLRQVTGRSQHPKGNLPSSGDNQTANQAPAAPSDQTRRSNSVTMEAQADPTTEQLSDRPEFSGAPAQLTGGRFTYDSLYGKLVNPFEGGIGWSNRRGGSSWLQYTYPQPVQVGTIHIEMAGTDVTSAGSSISVSVQEGSTWRTVYKLTDKVINRSFSGGNRGPQVGPQTIKVGGGAVNAIRVDMTGHGWFAASDIRVFSP